MELTEEELQAKKIWRACHMERQRMFLKELELLPQAFAVIVSILLCALMLIGSCRPVHAQEPMTEENILRAAIGEAAGEGIIGMEAVCRAILNRGHLKGVYGLNGNYVRYATKQDWKNARQALKRAKTRDITDHATGWGNEGDLMQFRRKGWFKRCVITKKIGNHYFYKELKG